MKKRNHKNADSPLGTPAPQLDLFLSEEHLIQLARSHLKGALPPNLFQDRHSKTPPQAQSVHKAKSLLAKELETRAWTYKDLAQATGLPESECVALAKGNARVRPEVAQILAQCFATSEEFWL